MKVYLIEAPVSGQIKIGISDVPFRRVAFLQTEWREQLFLRHEHDAGSSSEARRIERCAHIILSDRRVKGEWFNVSLDEAMGALAEAIDTPAPKQRKESHAKKLIAVRLSAEALDTLNRLAPSYGSQANVIVAGLKLLANPDEIPKESVMAALRSRLEEA